MTIKTTPDSIYVVPCENQQTVWKSPENQACHGNIDSAIMRPDIQTTNELHSPFTQSEPRGSHSRRVKVSALFVCGPHSSLLLHSLTCLHLLLRGEKVQTCNREPCRWGAGEVTTAFLPKHVEQIKASSLGEVVIAGLEEPKKKIN